MIWVGLTGGIASGKSTVAGIFSELGVEVVSADRLAHDVIACGTEGARRVREMFGEGVMSKDGSVDRAKLATVVFGDPTGTERARLEGLIHPEVRKKSKMERARLEARGDSVAIYEIPLLFEKNLASEFDFIVTVAISRELQIDRLIRRNSMTREEALKRIASQKSQDEKIKGSDFVIWNDGSLADLRKQVEVVKTSLVTKRN